MGTRFGVSRTRTTRRGPRDQKLSRPGRAGRKSTSYRHARVPARSSSTTSRRWSRGRRGTWCSLLTPTSPPTRWRSRTSSRRPAFTLLPTGDKPEDLHVSDYKYWVSHITFDDTGIGYDTGKALFKAIGGKGKVFAIQGLLGNAAAQGRWNGFQKALKETPSIELVGWQAGDWERRSHTTSSPTRSSLIPISRPSGARTTPWPSGRWKRFEAGT